MKLTMNFEAQEIVVGSNPLRGSEVGEPRSPTPY